MNFQQNSPQKSSDDSTHRSLQNCMPDYSWEHFKSEGIRLYGRDPNIYWKSNYYLTNQSAFHRSINLSLLEDRLELYLLREHKQVIFQQLLELQQYLAEDQTMSFAVQQTCNQVNEREMGHYFFEDLFQVQTFSIWEAQQFKEALLKRNDWRKLFFKLTGFLDKRLFWQLTYIFYVSLKLVEQFNHFANPNFNHLENILDQYLQLNSIILKAKLQYLGFFTDFDYHVKIIMFTIILALSGSFTNKFLNRNNAKILYGSGVSIKNEESYRQKKIKVLNVKVRQQRMTEIKDLPRKKVKILLS